MLSGVGPAEHLAEHNIPVVADMPGVGSNLLDHPVIDFNLLDKTGSSIMKLHSPGFSNKLGFIRELMYYNLTGKGMLTGNVLFLTFLRPVGFTHFNDVDGGSDCVRARHGSQALPA